MLQCIPALSSFHNVPTFWEQENIMAAAVILRQYEELEDDDGPQDGSGESSGDEIHPVNFVQVTQTIIEESRVLENRSSLANAILWMALRQEIYFCVMKERAPRMRLNARDRSEASAANRPIIYAADVANWCWGERSPEEWSERALSTEISGWMA